MFNSLRRIIGLAWQNLTRDGGVAMATIFILMIPVLLTTALFLLKDVSNYLVNELQNKADISIYFNESVTEDAILKVQDTLKQIPGVTETGYVSKDQAFESFSQRHKDNAVLLESLQETNGNPFFSSLNVSAESTAQYQQISDLLAGPDYRDLINEINYNEKKDVIEKIFSLTSQTQKIGLILFAILGVISLLVTFNAIRMAILSHGVEIGIQRLVGAARWFIRGQFLVEGVIFGVLATAFSMMVTAAVCWYLTPLLSTLMPGLNLWQNFNVAFWPLLGVQLGIATGLAVISSMLAMSRYLKV